MQTLGGHRGAVRAVAYLPDGRLVSAGQDGRVLLHRADGSPELLHKSRHPVYALAVRPGGEQIAVAGRPPPGDASNPVVLVSLAGGRTTATLGCMVEDQVYERQSHDLIRLVTRPVARTVWSLGWSADGRLLAAAVRQPGGGNIPEGGGGRWWDIASRETRPLPADAFALGFAPTGHELAVCRSRVVEGYAAPGDAEPAWRLPLTAAWGTVTYLTTGRPVAATGSFVYFRHRPRVKTGLRAVTAVAVTPGGGAVLVGGAPGGLEGYDAESGERRAAYDFGLGVVHAVAVAGDGLTAAVAGEKGLGVVDLDFG